MGASFKKMLTIFKAVSSFFAALLQLVGFIIPLVAPLMITRAWPFKEAEPWVQTVGCVLAVGLAVVLVVWFLFNYFRGKSQYDDYMPIFMETISSISENKYNRLCQEIETGKCHEENQILLYDAHEVIRDMNMHIKHLVSAITGVKLNNLSVTFIYKYEGEHWKEIGGSSVCTFGQLDEMVESNERQTMFHHLYSGESNYCFLNNKRDGIGTMYELSIRDKKNINRLGSIFCRRFFCTVHGKRVVDAMVSVSSYNERFSSGFMPLSCRTIEGLLNEAFDSCEQLFKIEMASMYLRHQYRKPFEITTLLVEQGWLDDNDVDDAERIGEAVECFKNRVNARLASIRYGAPVDGSLSAELMDDLKSGQYKNESSK